MADCKSSLCAFTMDDKNVVNIHNGIVLRNKED